MSSRQKSSDLTTLIKWVVIFSWRFFTGAHMNGKIYNDSSWWHDASTRFKARRHTYTWWRRKARMKRAGWRNICFWLAALVVLGFVLFTSEMLFALMALSPFMGWVAYRRTRSVLFVPFTSGNSDGSVNQHWRLKPVIRRRMERLHLLRKLEPEKRTRPGLAHPSELGKAMRVKPVPTEYANAVRRELAPELDGEPPIELKLLMAPD